MALIPFKQNNSLWRTSLADLERIQREMNRFFDHAVPGTGESNVSLWAGDWSPAVDVVEKKDELIVKADLPGLGKEDIDVSIENNVLMIRGEKKQEGEYKDGEVIRSERYYGSFHRAFTLPSTVDPDKVGARFHDGVLELTISKKEEAKSRQIKIAVK